LFPGRGALRSGNWLLAKRFTLPAFISSVEVEDKHRQKEALRFQKLAKKEALPPASWRGRPSRNQRSCRHALWPGFVLITQEIFGDVTADFDIEALRLAFAVNVAEGRFVAEDADAYFTFGFDFIRGDSEDGRDKACGDERG